jgi:hypothetical protein
MLRDLLASHAGVPAYAVGLVLTLVLAARCTPRHWWRRPTLRGGAVLAGGTLAIGTLLLALAGRPPTALGRAQAVLATAATPANLVRLPAAATEASPEAGASYRVAEELNLRTTRGVYAPRLAILPAGSRVVASGAVDGDWWQVRARVDGRELTGWTSSLWLRRRGEP